MKRLTSLSLALFLVAGCSAGTHSLSFDDGTLGKAPAGFTVAQTGDGAAPQWVIRNEGEASQNSQVLVQESTDPTVARYPLCIYDAILARDVEVKVRFKTLSGQVDQAAGLVLRYRPDAYYVARANALENNVVLFKTIEGKREKVKEAKVEVPSGQWQSIGFEARGPRLVVRLNDQIVVDTTDSSINTAGKVGLWTKADSVTAFSRFEIRTLDH